MRYRNLIGAVMLMGGCSSFGTYTLNEVRAIINGPQETALILSSDIRRSLTGQERTLRDLVLEQLMLFDAQKLNIQIGQEEVEKDLKQLEKTYGYTRAQIDELFNKFGFTNEEGREQLRRKKVIENILSYRLHTGRKSVVEQQDVEDYWRLHGPWEEATYTLVTATIKSNETLEQVQARLTKPAAQATLTWGAPFTVKAADLPDDKKRLLDKPIGTLVSIEPAQDGFEVTKLQARTERHAVPLVTGNAEEDKKNRAQIEQAIQQQWFKDAHEAYEQSLLKEASIRFTSQADQQAVMGSLKSASAK